MRIYRCIHLVGKHLRPFHTIDKTWIEQMMQHASTRNQAFSSFGYTREGRLNRTIAGIGNFGFFTINKIITGHYPLLGSNFVVSKNVWNKVGRNLSLRTDLFEDVELGLLAVAAGYNTSLVRKHNTQISIRFLDIGAKNLHRRLLGWPKTYWKYKKLAAILSVPLIYIFLVLVWI